MQIQVNTDHNIEAHKDLIEQISSIVENALDRYSADITQVDVHLSDENSDKKSGENDMRCVIETHLKGHQPFAVTHQATTLFKAVEEAADKLANLIENTLERQRDQEMHRTDPSVAEPGFKNLA